MSFTVNVGYDETERRYFVLSSDIPGLNIEAGTFEEFVEAAQDAAPVRRNVVISHTADSALKDAGLPKAF
jgi:predicted RNase H-like HicB family nuclease